MSRLPNSRRAVAGFTLIELMISLVVGLIVVGAVLAFTVSSIRANSDYVKSTRLMQELRNSSDFLTNELKRAGYDEAAMNYVANPATLQVSKFAPILVDTSVAGQPCVIYAYDRQPGLAGEIDLASGEIRAFRRTTTTLGGQTVGVVEVAESATSVTPACDGAGPDYSQYPTVCNAATGWCPLSDPRVVDITGFTIGTTSSGAAAKSNGVQTIAAAPGFNAMQLREFLLTLTGSLRNDATLSRTVESNIKVRADCLRANVAACNAAPTP